MAKVVLVLEYNGSRYHGFQFQINVPTIQGELEKALNKLTGEDIRVIAASRTDAGVHAKGQVISFRTKAHFTPEVWVKALNFYLPRDIVVKKAFLVGEEVDIRKQAISREYWYLILNSATPSPLKANFFYFIPHPLDIEAMRSACDFLVGEKDFASFTPSTEVRNTIRKVYRAEIKKKGEMLLFSIEANSFLPHQVRHTIGALIRVGRGRMKVEEFKGILEAKIRGLAGPALPPNALYLMKIKYPPYLLGQ